MSPELPSQLRPERLQRCGAEEAGEEDGPDKMHTSFFISDQKRQSNHKREKEEERCILLGTEPMHCSHSQSQSWPSCAPWPLFLTISTPHLPHPKSRAVSNKINKDTLCLLLKVHGDAVVSFPLYYEALKFSHHREKMIQTAICALTLSIYNVSDDMAYEYITTPPVSKYFSELVASLREQFFHLDSLVQATNGMLTYQKREELLLETDEIIDDLYYLKDMLDVGDSHLSRVVMENLLRDLVFPILLPLLQLRQINGSNLSVVTTFYTVSRLLQVIGGKCMFNSMAGIILYPYMSSSVRDSIERNLTHSIGEAKSMFNQLSDMENVVPSNPKAEGAERMSWPRDNISIHSSGIIAHIFSESYSLLLSSLFVLFILAEAKDLHPLLLQMIGLNGIQDMLEPDGKNRNIIVIYRDQIINALLKVLASRPPFSILIQWHTGWFLLKLLSFQGNGLSCENLQLFSVSYQQSREYLQKELDGCWFDHIPEVLRNEWAGCKAGYMHPPS